MPRDERSERLAEAIRRRVAQGIVGAMKRDDRSLRRLRELGLIDDAWLADPGADPMDLLRRLQRRAREIRERPSLLGDLGVGSVDVLCCESENRGPGALPDGPDLTVAFTDLEGFTHFTRQQGDREASRLLEAHYAAVDDLVAGRGGRVIKRLGDGHLLTFPQPRAAVLAGLDLLEAPPGPLRLRVGEHAGSVVVMGEDVLGHVVNVASRVVGAATGGQALVTAEVRDRAGAVPRVEFGEVRPTLLKGIEEPVPVCEVKRG
ncbi:MAG: adenylate/guanylate cyclase domain-containing protein [Acidimicrobiia bacterium]|nr:adenylate/guanylate cyclase domain-containing protein [Acidimicrobiia bacterium]